MGKSTLILEESPESILETFLKFCPSAKQNLDDIAKTYMEGDEIHWNITLKIQMDWNAMRTSEIMKLYRN